MPILPPILPTIPPTGGLNKPGGIGRAQDFSVSKLQQRVDREQTAVSINQMLGRHPGKGSEYDKSTSVFHPGGESQPAITSIARVGDAARSVNEASGGEDAGADDRRYTYMRKLIKERQAKEAEVARQETSDKGMGVKTGRAFNTVKFKKQMSKMATVQHSTYGNLSKGDRNYFTGLVGRYAKAKTAGTGFGLTERKQMKMEIERARRGGTISAEDAKDMKGMVDTMK